ncbi:glycoside hydrolase, partial [Candidatus Saccharibacteria bacterium]|nr:glycoside hydrolase [Candidatus Saccharibacteria bacterium]
DQRMDNLDALLYYLVIRKIRGKKYDIKSILKHNPYAIQDANFNSILVRANSCLVRIAEVTGTNLPTSLLQNISNTQKALDILWDETAKQYYSKNYYTKKLIRVPSIATLLPLYAGTISTKKAKHLVDMLKNSNFFGAEYPVPSVPLNSKDFNSMRYWQGPTWVNTNWLIIKGLQRYGYNDEANIIRQKTIDLVDKHGCYEYYSAIDGLPAGAPNFSWTASLVLDLILDS